MTQHCQSLRAAWVIGKHKKPFLDTELIKECMSGMMEAMQEGKQQDEMKEKINQIPLSGFSAPKTKGDSCWRFAPATLWWHKKEQVILTCQHWWSTFHDREREGIRNSPPWSDISLHTPVCFCVLAWMKCTQKSRHLWWDTFLTEVGATFDDLLLHNNVRLLCKDRVLEHFGAICTELQTFLSELNLFHAKWREKQLYFWRM